MFNKHVRDKADVTDKSGLGLKYKVEVFDNPWCTFVSFGWVEQRGMTTSHIKGWPEDINEMETGGHLDGGPCHRELSWYPENKMSFMDNWNCFGGNLV